MVLFFVAELQPVVCARLPLVKTAVQVSTKPIALSRRDTRVRGATEVTGASVNRIQPKTQVGTRSQQCIPRSPYQLIPKRCYPAVAGHTPTWINLTA